ncbi:MAG TPA: AAA family ATPase [Tepidisphaeraceae bacterium]|jgi:putative nucleotidyltransferase with HDIG domain
MSCAFEHTPSPPDFRVDWESIARFPWIASMTGVQQEPEWHAEGDVFIHTRMVAEAMAAMDTWRALPHSDRHVLFAAALLHDVAKPACTRVEDGRWTSPKHAKVGEGMARHLLWTGTAGGVPGFYERERIAKLVRYHGLPLRFMDKPDPRRALILASLEVGLADVALLAMADVLGRQCAGKHELIDSVRTFTDYAAELECLTEARRFEHEHHRFMYCVGRKPLDYVPYRDEQGFEVVLMSGLPGSGKSTIARQIAGDRPVIRLDAIRERLDIDGAENQSVVVDEARELARSYLRQRQSFVWDATNTTKDMRSGLVALFANYGATVRIVYVEAPSWQEMFARNRQREHPVPERVIARLAERLEIPSPAKAHWVEYVISDRIR